MSESLLREAITSCIQQAGRTPNRKNEYILKVYHRGALSERHCQLHMVCYDTQLTPIITGFGAIKAGLSRNTPHSTLYRTSSLLQTLQSFSSVGLSVPSTFLRSTAAATVMAPVGNPSLFMRFVSKRCLEWRQHLVVNTAAPGLTAPAAALLVAVRPGGELPTLRSAGEYSLC
jgi:hypothetical protein